jgi:peptidoglycan/xylan/chitin deacetylase (PgdA/CDA1 family)
MTNLWHQNTPSNFWRCQPDFPKEVWDNAICKAIPELGLPARVDDIETALGLTIGEGRFGPDHWRLSQARRLYYLLKPLLPRAAIDLVKKSNSRVAVGSFPLDWPVENRYVKFQWEVLKQVLIITGCSPVEFRSLWPEKKRFAFVLTHDVETEDGQVFVRNIADLEEQLGFRSSFNFVPESYPLDHGLIDELRERGFEIGIHGLKHDGKLFSSQTRFMQRAERINRYLSEFHAVGFRSPLTHRHPEWMQCLEIDYDLSFFDTDPYEPIPGGCMSIWPFILGRFVELPYTLVQDCTLGLVLEEDTPQLWLEKIDFIKQYYGMALLNAHPDYLILPKMWEIYADFLTAMKEIGGYWHALPREVARWWLDRADRHMSDDGSVQNMGKITLHNDQIMITI